MSQNERPFDAHNSKTMYRLRQYDLSLEQIWVATSRSTYVHGPCERAWDFKQMR